MQQYVNTLSVAPATVYKKESVAFATAERCFPHCKENDLGTDQSVASATLCEKLKVLHLQHFSFNCCDCNNITQIDVLQMQHISPECCKYHSVKTLQVWHLQQYAL